MQKVPFFVSWCFLFFLVTPGDGYASGDICINFCLSNSVYGDSG